MTAMAAMAATTATTETDVLIVGAGPVGMTLALTLRRRDVRVTIVDKEPTTGRFTRAAIVWPRTLEVLDLLGIADDWEAEGVPIQNFHFSIDGDEAVLPVTREASPHPHPLGIGQDRTEALLDARLRASGADYRRGVEMVALQLDAGGGTATLRAADGGAETTVRAAWVVGCDGSRSPVRFAADMRRTGEQNAGVQIIQGDACIATSWTLPPGHGFLWNRADHRALLLLLPTSRDRHYRVLVTLPDDGAQGDPTLEQIQERARFFLPDVVLSNPLWRNRFRTQHQIASRYRSGRALVAGDAAHVWVPIGGQGMNIGMQDAFDLGWKLAGVIRGELPEAAIDTYEAERRPIGERNVADTERLYGALLGTHTLADAALRHLLPRALGFNPLAERFADRFSELDFHYAPDLLVAADHGHGAPATGMRAPDAYVARAGTGDTIRLFDLFRTGRWTALAWAVRAGEYRAADGLVGLTYPNLDRYLIDATPDGVEGSPSLAVLRDQPRLAMRAYGVGAAEVHIIRPDGVIAYRGPADAKALQRFLDPILAGGDTMSA